MVEDEEHVGDHSSQIIQAHLEAVALSQLSSSVFGRLVADGCEGHESTLLSSGDASTSRLPHRPAASMMKIILKSPSSLYSDEDDTPIADRPFIEVNLISDNARTHSGSHRRETPTSLSSTSSNLQHPVAGSRRSLPPAANRQWDCLRYSVVGFPTLAKNRWESQSRTPSDRKSADRTRTSSPIDDGIRAVARRTSSTPSPLISSRSPSPVANTTNTFSRSSTPFDLTSSNSHPGAVSSPSAGWDSSSYRKDEKNFPIDGTYTPQNDDYSRPLGEGIYSLNMPRRRHSGDIATNQSPRQASSRRHTLTTATVGPVGSSLGLHYTDKASETIRAHDHDPSEGSPSPHSKEEYSSLAAKKQRYNRDKIVKDRASSSLKSPPAMSLPEAALDVDLAPPQRMNSATDIDGKLSPPQRMKSIESLDFDLSPPRRADSPEDVVENQGSVNTGVSTDGHRQGGAGGNSSSSTSDFIKNKSLAISDEARRSQRRHLSVPSSEPFGTSSGLILMTSNDDDWQHPADHRDRKPSSQRMGKLRILEGFLDPYDANSVGVAEVQQTARTTSTPLGDRKAQANMVGRPGYSTTQGENPFDSDAKFTSPEGALQLPQRRISSESEDDTIFGDRRTTDPLSGHHQELRNLDESSLLSSDDDHGFREPPTHTDSHDLTRLRQSPQLHPPRRVGLSKLAIAASLKLSPPIVQRPASFDTVPPSTTADMGNEPSVDGIQ